MTERWSKEIFSPSQAIERIQFLIKKESGKVINQSTIQKALTEQYSKNPSSETLSKALDITAKTADIIASILTAINSSNQ